MIAPSVTNGNPSPIALHALGSAFDHLVTAAEDLAATAQRRDSGAAAGNALRAARLASVTHALAKIVASEVRRG